MRRASMAAKSTASVSYGASSGENNATTNIATMTPPPIAPSGRMRQNSRTAPSQRLSVLGAAASIASGTGTGTRATAMGSPVPDARVDPCVPHVHQEVRDDEAAGHQHHQRLDQRVVAMGHRLYEQQSEAVQIEHLLGHDQAADQEGELERDDGQHRQHGVLERVARQDQALHET